MRCANAHDPQSQQPSQPFFASSDPDDCFPGQLPVAVQESGGSNPRAL